jgi:hypothetical protein
MGTKRKSAIQLMSLVILDVYRGGKFIDLPIMGKFSGGIFYHGFARVKRNWSI